MPFRRLEPLMEEAETQRDSNMNVQTSNQVFHKAAIAKWVGNSLMCLRVVICSQQKHRSQLYLDLKCRVQFNLSYKKRSS